MSVFAKHLGRFVESAGAGLYQEGLAIMHESQQLVPVLTGTLRASGRVLAPEIEGDLVTVTLGYGYGETTNPQTGESASGYAIPVHERVDVVHPNGEAKFLEKPALERSDKLAGSVAVSITRAVKVGDVVETFEEQII